VPACGLDQFLHVFLPNTPISRDEQVLSAAAAAAEQWPEIHADALAVLLGIVTLPDGVWQLFNQQNPSLIPSQNPGSTAQQQQQRSPGHTRSNSSSSLHAAAGEAGLGEASAAAAARQQRLLLLDVRRHDERTLYGAIPGALHIPGAATSPSKPFRALMPPLQLSLNVLLLSQLLTWPWTGFGSEHHASRAHGVLGPQWVLSCITTAIVQVT
jgi:hypothetical protein